MFSRSKHNKTRHGSASSVDLTQQLNSSKPTTDSALAPIPGSPVQGSAPPPTKSSTGGRAFNFLVERARGGTSRARTTSDEGHNSKGKQQAESGQEQSGRPVTAGTTGSSSGGGGGGLFGRKGSITPAEVSSVASSSNPSVANSINIPGSSAESTAPPTKSSGGFFRRQITQSNPPKPGWLGKGASAQQAAPSPSPLSASPSSPTLVKTSELPMPETTKKDQYGRKQSLPVSESGGLLASSRRAFSRSVEDLTGRRSSKYSTHTVYSNDEEPPPLPTMSNSRSAADPLTTLADQAKTDRAVTTRRNRTTSLFPSSVGSMAIAQLARPDPNSASPIIPGPVADSPVLERGSPMATSASVPNFRIGTFNSTGKSPDPAGKRDSQTIVLQGFLQRKRDYMPVSPGGAGGKSPSSFSAPLHNGDKSPAAEKAPVAGSTSQGYFPSFRLKTPGSGSSRGEPDLSKNWKPSAAVLRGSKLYLHKVPSDIEKAAKSLFPTGLIFSTDHTHSPATSASPSTSKHSPLPQSSPSPQTLKLLNEWTPTSKPYLVLSLSGVEVHHYDNSQRSFVFELITEDGQRSLLQASSKEQLDSWTDNFHRAGTEIAHRRATLLAQTPLAEKPEPVVHEAKHVATLAPSGSVIKASTTLFSVSLWEIVQREGTTLPRFVDTVLTAIEACGLSEVGIYRISGESKIIQSLKESLNKGADPVKLFEGVDVHNLTGVFKLWLREMPELIPFELYHSFISADAIDGYDERLYSIRDLVWQMPQPHFNLIKRLMEHLDRITDNEQVNAMHAQNLALVLAPTLLRPPPGPDSFGLAMINLGKAAKVVSSLILQSAWVFGDGQEEEQAEAGVAEGQEGEEADEVEREIMEAANGTSQAPAVGLGLETGALAPSVEVTKEDDVAEEDRAPLAAAEHAPTEGVPAEKLIPALAAGEPAAVEEAEAIERPATPPPDAEPTAPAPTSPGDSSSPTSDTFFDTTTSPVPASSRLPGAEGNGSPTPGASRPLSMMALKLDELKLPEQGLMSPMDEGVFATFGAGQEGKAELDGKSE